jgi:hypothetical protein
MRFHLMQQHLETRFARTTGNDPDASLVPGHVEHELRGFLKCAVAINPNTRCPILSG